MHPDALHRRSTAPVPAADLADPSRLLTAAGARGELLVAGVRLLLVLAALPAVVGRLVAMPADPWSRWLLAIALAALLYALCVVALCRQRACGTWLGYGTAAIDIGVITLVLGLALLGEGRDVEVAGSLAVALYLLAIAASGLRFVTGIALLTGTLAMAGYGAVIAVADALWRPDEEWLPGLAAGVVWPFHAANLLVMALATFLATAAVVRARELRRVSLRDPLTGLFNRGCFDECLEEVAAAVRRGGGGFAVALLDLDHFKRTNDTFGHRAGDQVLRQVAQRLSASFRGDDVIGRYGGEEFAIVLPNTTLAEARWRIEELRRAMAAAPFTIEEGHVLDTVTFSAGIAACPADGLEAGEVLRCADACLYAAKSAGRDRLMTSEELRAASPAPSRTAAATPAERAPVPGVEPVPVGER